MTTVAVVLTGTYSCGSVLFPALFLNVNGAKIRIPCVSKFTISYTLHSGVVERTAQSRDSRRRPDAQLIDPHMMVVW